MFDVPEPKFPFRDDHDSDTDEADTDADSAVFNHHVTLSLTRNEDSSYTTHGWIFIDSTEAAQWRSHPSADAASFSRWLPLAHRS